jgi:hypothetical protein
MKTNYPVRPYLLYNREDRYNAHEFLKEIDSRYLKAIGNGPYA